MRLLLKVAAITLLALMNCKLSLAQFPPAQGPPPVSANHIQPEFALILLTSGIESMIKDSILPAVNSNISASNPPVGIRLALSSLKIRRPYMSSTEYTERPNEKIIVVNYDVDYKVIINGLPNRHLLQNLRVVFKCNNWFEAQGGELQSVFHSDPIYLADASFTEGVINAFLLNKYTPFVDNKIREQLMKFPGAMTNLIALNGFNTTCNCLSLYEGEAPDYYGAVRYQYKEPKRLHLESVNNTVKVSLAKIKRLKARSDNASVLYDSVENISVEVFVNQKLEVFQIGSIVEGQEIELPSNLITVKAPGKTESLILIANVVQDQFKTDSRFSVYKSADRFGNGTKKLIVQKSYIMKPFRLPTGELTKPREIKVDAYELTFNITAPPLRELQVGGVR